MNRALMLAMLCALAEACTPTETTLGQTGAYCDTDEQCDKDKSLVCRCVRRRNPDEEGPDEILAHGTCQLSTYKCPVDGGGADVSPADTATTDTSATDAASDVPAETSDAADAG